MSLDKYSRLTICVLFAASNKNDAVLPSSSNVVGSFLDGVDPAFGIAVAK